MTSAMTFSSTASVSNTTLYSPTVSRATFVIHSDLPLILERYVITPLFFMSLTGNSLIFVVFSMKEYRSNLTAMVYRILALTDGLVVLIQDGLHTLPLLIIGKSVPCLNGTTCKAFVFILHLLRAFSLWLMFVISVERFICVWLPHRAPRLNTKRNYGGFIFALFLIMCLLYVPLTLTTEYAVQNKNGQDEGICEILGDHEDRLRWYHEAFDILHMIVCGFLPFVLVFFSNITIIYRLIMLQRATESSTNQSSNKGGLRNRNVIIMLLISSSSVVLALLDPIYVLLTNKIENRDSTAFERAMIFGYFTPVFDSVNRFINIIIISVFGKQFRQNLRQLFACHLQRNLHQMPLHVVRANEIQGRKSSYHWETGSLCWLKIDSRPCHFWSLERT